MWPAAVLLDSQESHATRPLDWRFQRGLYLAQHRPEPLPARRMRDDRFVQVARIILLELEEADGDLWRTFCVEDYPAAVRAFQIHYFPQHREQRELLKAWLLTRASDEEVANRVGCQPEVVEYFEGMFFHIRDRLQNASWIRLAALKRPPVRNSRDSNVLTDSQRWWVRQTFAYYGGPQVLEILLDGFRGAPAQVAGPAVAEWFNERMREQVRECAVLAASALSVNQRDMIRMTKMATKNLGPGLRSNNGQPAESEIRVAKMLRELIPMLPPDDNEKATC